ncbi:hypothetical protein PABG_05283 [Paracoccidioides brasiliensis Pb03]|uniref:Uncharacterized protein n=2 Tax=Paracoccidioides brasiliensis TaxID=121759 RepID=C1GI90_PARBD|nr:uncharacterized protein PADG_06976 [Paracoccidioides brasiliensis Pb18]EEH23072.1 hypothetical protein PABG_05283 [Paracoccidioides brasiliensis Pb03]EEH42156.2 hypothetical protein PADG_06976 [Paracoccidioides brasiliensis Pb18]ODH20678.1 hypothetical protein ACO22_05819 [Paracoccidioides brasiliensis]ODH49184.1 hypothetical protein GX48_04691 [Paracoccidioides brasiliensis]
MSSNLSILTLLCFRQSSLFPQETAHWALQVLLWNPNAPSGSLFHVSKESLASGQTSYRLVRNVNPMASSSLRALVEVASGVRLTDQMLDAHCISIAHDRSFDLVYNNSQRFCSQVLQRLVYNRVITQSQFDELALKGFQPLV